MARQFNCVKEMLLPDVAEYFQHLGYNVLLYDGRSIGASDGEPRNQLNPYQMAEDLSGEFVCAPMECLSPPLLTHLPAQTS